MRRVNAILGALLVIVFAVHAALGAIELITFAYLPFVKVLAWVGSCIALIHIIISIILFVKSARGGQITRHAKENAGFWVQRISGLLIVVLLLVGAHFVGGTVDGQYVMYGWNAWRLTLCIVFLVCLGAHLFTSTAALNVSLGLGLPASAVRAVQIAMVLLVLFCIFAFCLFAKGMWV